MCFHVHVISNHEQNLQSVWLFVRYKASSEKSTLLT